MKRSLCGILILLFLLGAMNTAGYAVTENKKCNHEWKLVRLTEPTCTKGGKEKYRCSLCGDEKTEKLPALGHEWSLCTVLKAPTCTEEGIIRCYCSRDASHYKDETMEPLGHQWGDWITIKYADLTRPGKKQRTCERCGAVESKQTPPLIRRPDYDLTLMIFPEESVLRDISAEQLALSGSTGFPMEWTGAVANTGKKDLWIVKASDTQQQERIPLAAGEVLLLPFRFFVNASDFQLNQRSAEITLQLFGETEAGECVCQSKKYSGRVRLLPDAQQAIAPGLTLSQELVPASPPEGGYRAEDAVRFSISVANTGNASISQLEIRDFAGDEPMVLERLAPGETKTVVREHRITRADAIAGYLCWALTARAVPDGGGEAFSVSSDPLMIPVGAD